MVALDTLTPADQRADPRREAVAGVFAGHAAAAQAALIDGEPGAVWAPEGRARAAFVLRWSQGKIVQIQIVADPRRLHGPARRGGGDAGAPCLEPP